MIDYDSIQIRSRVIGKTGLLAVDEFADRELMTAGFVTAAQRVLTPDKGQTMNTGPGTGGDAHFLTRASNYLGFRVTVINASYDNRAAWLTFCAHFGSSQ